MATKVEQGGTLTNIQQENLEELQAQKQEINQALKEI